MDIGLIDGTLLGASWWLDPNNWLSMTKAALGLGFVIFVHELGHFLVAKMCGVQCDKFYVGFDPPIKIGPFQLPRALFRRQWGETEYGIGIIPLGGYVKMLGQDDNPANAAKEAERIRQEGGPEGGGELNPRSYPAKSVPQRMAIISAGVIMNLIFAVIFASLAFRVGIDYLPCGVGRVLAGDPAWEAGLQPGDQIIQLGEEGEPQETLRFVKDLRPSVLMTGSGNEMKILVRRDGQEIWTTPKPASAVKGHSSGPTIGILQFRSLGLDAKTPTLPGTAAADASVPLEGGEVITAVEAAGETIAVTNATELDRAMFRFRDDPIKLHLERPTPAQNESRTSAPSTIVTDITPQPMRNFGLAMEIGPVTAIRNGSPAATVDIRPGDILRTVDGDPIGDPMLLDELLRRHANSEVVIGVERDGSQHNVTITPIDEGIPAEIFRPGSPCACDAIGVAYDVTSKIASIDPNGPAATAGLQVGDTVTKVIFRPHPNATDTIKEYLTKAPRKLDPELPNWPLVISELQGLASPSVEMEYRRGGSVNSCEVAVAASDTTNYWERGLILQSLTRQRKAASWGEALALGWKETKESVGLVLSILKRITRRDTLSSLGGPGAIAVTATMSASQGLSSLLTFLTMLSANLAVINFLPIPVLDGGHMVFLLWEGIFRKPLNERVMMGLTFAGLSFILGLMIFLIGKDFVMFSGM